MKQIADFLASLGITVPTAIFATLGSLLAVLRHRECSWQENVVTFLTGLAFALVAPGALIKWFSLAQDPAYFGGLGFVFGYFGMSVMDEAMSVLKSDDFRNKVLSILPGSKKGGE